MRKSNHVKADAKARPTAQHSVKKGTLGRILKYFWKDNKGYTVAIVVCLLLSSVAGIASSVFLQQLIDGCITPGLKEGFDAVSARLTATLLTMAGVFVIGLICNFIYTRLMAVLSQSMLHRFRVEMFDAMESLPIKYFDTHAHGDIMSCYTNDADTLRQLISQSVPQLLTSIITITALFFVMLTYSVWLTLIVLACVALMLLCAKYIGGNSAKYFVRQQYSIGKTEGFVEEMMEGQKVVKVFCHEREAERDFDVVNDELYDDSEKANSFANVLMPILGNIGNFMYVIVAIAGGALAVTGAFNVSLSGTGVLELGVIVSFLTMSRQFALAISQVSQQVNAVAMGLAGASRVFDLIDQKPEFDEGYVTLVNAKFENGEIVESTERTGTWAWRHPHKQDGTVTYTQLKGDIRMFEVDFGYTEDKMVLHDVSLYAEPGQKIAFVGATGAGKTTITNLLNRFYDIADGKIRYDGININKIRKSDLRRSLGIVLQDTNLFTGTVMENIRYGNMTATDEEVYEAARLANADDFIRRLPEGYNTMLSGNGANLSQGQRQLLSIARAAAADAPVMILDEATSSIDTRTEALVQQGMDNLMKDRTVFVIAHRLSTIRNSDVIMVLDHGRIIERGTHEQLLAEQGVYYRLYTGDFELE